MEIFQKFSAFDHPVNKYGLTDV